MRKLKPSDWRTLNLILLNEKRALSPDKHTSASGLVKCRLVTRAVESNYNFPSNYLSCDANEIRLSSLNLDMRIETDEKHNGAIV